jgi:Fe-S-cluster containining protein
MHDQKPWYRDGLRFRCIGCGGCCTGAPGYVWLNSGDVAALAEALGIDAERFEARHVRRVGVRKSLVELPNGDCVFFDRGTGGCQLYAARPRQCRTWPFWPSNLKSREAWDEMARHCPGANRGRLYKLGEILAASEVVRV